MTAIGPLLLRRLDDPPDTNRQVLIWTAYYEWVIAYYDHRWYFSKNHEGDEPPDLEDIFGWRECPEPPPDSLCPVADKNLN